MAGTWQCHSPDLELTSGLKDRLTNLTRASQIPWERGFIADPMNLFTPRPRVSQSKIFEVNPLPRSCLIASGNEWVVITLSRRALTVDFALVLLVIINSTYIEKQFGTRAVMLLVKIQEQTIALPTLNLVWFGQLLPFPIQSVVFTTATLVVIYNVKICIPQVI